MLTFDDETHTYRWGDKVVPSVTQCLSRLHSFGMVNQEVLEAACVRGSHVHAICEYHDQQDLDPSSIGIYQGYFDAWLAFCSEHQAKWAGIEVAGYSERFGFAGTYDRLGTLKDAPFIVDIKTSQSSHRVWGLQTAAYRQLCAEQDAQWMTARRATVQLRPDGTYKFKEWTDPSDWTTFLALIQLINWSNK